MSEHEDQDVEPGQCPVQISSIVEGSEVQGRATESITYDSVSSEVIDCPHMENPLSGKLMPHVLEVIDQDSLDTYYPPLIPNSTCSSHMLDGCGLQERWDVDKDAAAYLSSIIAFSKIYDAGELVEMPHVFRARLRMEKPVLDLDAELDLRRIRCRNRIILSSRGMPPYPLHTEADEAMQWPTRYLEFPQKKDEQIAKERLSITKDAVEYLKHISHPETPTREEMETVFLDGPEPHCRRHITPPLLPQSPPLSALYLPNIVQHMDLTSSPEDSIAIEASKLDRQIMVRDDLDSTQADIVADMSSPALDEIRQDHNPKTEVPLLPASPLICSPLLGQAVSFPETVRTLVPIGGMNAPMVLESEWHEDIDTFMNEVVIPLAKPAIAKSDKEKLVEFDTTMRVDVPVILDNPLAPPWKAFDNLDPLFSRLENHRAVLRQTRVDCMHDVKKWGGVSKLEKILPWCAFPARLAKVDVEELFDDGSADRYMGELLADINVDCAMMIPTMEGLTLLDERTDEDDLEPALFIEFQCTSPECLTSLNSQEVKKNNEQYRPQLSRYFDKSRGTALAASYSTGSAFVRPQSAQGRESVTLPVNPRKPVKTIELLPTASRQTEPLPENVEMTAETLVTHARTSMRELLAKRKLELDSCYPNKKTTVTASGSALATQSSHSLSNGSSLESFLRLQGSVVGSLAEAADVPALPTTGPSVDTTVVDHPHPVVAHQPLPAPKIIAPDQPMQVVFSPQVFAARAMVRELLSLLPSLDPIERSNLSTSDDGNGTGQYHNKFYAEADMVLCPSTGLILTTLQKLKQKPLPGQTSFHGIREHVVAVARGFQTLLVLVHDARAMPFLDDNDTDALCDFTNFTLSLPTHIRVLYVPDSLERWLASVVLQYAVPCTPESKLLPEETTWERFLRVAGMNAFAAQVVLNQLKAPDVLGTESDNSSDGASEPVLYGLAAFLRLSLNARVQRFGPLVGGQRVLERVSAVIDGGW